MADESFSTFSRAPAVTLQFKNDRRDSSTEWMDVKNLLLRHYQLKEVIAGGVGYNIGWSADAIAKREQTRNVSFVLTALIRMSEKSPTLRSVVRKIESNNFTDARLLEEDVDKIRQLFIYYDEITERNDTKDVDLKKKLNTLRFDSTGRANLQTDVTTYFERIVHIQEEMQQIHRMSNFELVQMCSTELTKSIPALKAGMTTLNLSTISFDEMQRVTLSMCHNVEIYDGHDVHDNSFSNSTLQTPQPNKMLSMTSDQFQSAMRAVANGDSRSRDFRDHDRSSRGRTPPRGPYNDGGSSNYNGRSNRGRSQSPGSNRSRRRSRSRSQDNRRSSSRDRERSNRPRYYSNSTMSASNSTMSASVESVDFLASNPELRSELDKFLSNW